MIRLAVTVTARCLRCDWAAGPGDWRVDRQAERHSRGGHATATMATPATTTSAGSTPAAAPPTEGASIEHRRHRA